MRVTTATALLFLAAGCAGENTAPTTTTPGPRFTISDAVHSGGTQGFYFLPPMVAAASPSSAFDADLAAMDPRIKICDLAAGVDADCGGTTPSLLTFSTSSSPAITVDPVAEHYQVNWNTKAPGFENGHTYRIHVTAGAPTARRKLGFADVLLTNSPGQAKNVATGDLIVLKDGQTLPIKFRIETGIVGALAVSVAPGTVHVAEAATATAIALDLHGAPRSGVSLGWSASGVPASLGSGSTTTDGTGSAAVLVTAGATPGLATISAATNGLVAAGTLTIVTATTCIPSTFGAVINTPSHPSGPLFVTNQNANRVTVYPSGAVGNATPAATIEGAGTGLSVPRGIARDGAGNLYVANYGSNSILVFAPGASGAAAPTRIIAGTNTQLDGLEGLAVDGAGSVYVASQTQSKILVFGAGATGNVAPSRAIAGSCTGLNRPMGLALDGSGNLYVANLGGYTPGTNSVTVYPAGATGNVAPVLTIAGGSTQLYNPLGIAVDAGGSIYVSNYGNTDNGPTNFATAVTVFAAGSNGNAAPARTISGVLSEPTGLAIDDAGRLFVANFWDEYITIYGPGATGPATPAGLISGASTGLSRPAYLTF